MLAVKIQQTLNIDIRYTVPIRQHEGLISKPRNEALYSSAGLGAWASIHEVNTPVLRAAISRLNPAVRQVTANNEKVLRRSRYVKSENFVMPIEIILYGGRKVGVISLEEEFSMIIESEKIFLSLKSIFEAMWESLPEEKVNPIE